ncbi:DUF2993 domain-containing protein [Corynebacterium sp. 320]|uniref:DUF2993 domain-containing protein n=1 Tax=Corynebacterium zhongnanshanii TaxID=2768834 RepID=A0ABQ6VC37_9CORY|nr:MULTISPECIES: DUF2993 domain-containing protein [Corynebacterium]KAB1502998.1 DUF2993 domain-containing protein [Corynebacterium sp. 320]KAB1550791.1 DUF2993 domain-containing protein [Corynebacterium sp. 321]KAB1551148.1 DUF2993 domain-containing protein [Corynebacterium sp. 319]KAB3519794.1 DUF2993 domain-containing protein [Corynebacterium zhongnanshanii]KAB3526795.1 DUF2993 domain-containing protein [Corynebacterium sp. 250]
MNERDIATPHLSRGWKRTLVALGTLIGIVLGATLVDALIAARVEHKISQNLYEQSNLPSPPDVHLAGYPYVWAAVSHELQAVTVNAKDLDVPGFGLVSVYTSAQYVTIPRAAVFSGDIQNAPARKMFTRLQLDGVSIGSRMGLNDLHIQNLEDISPRGGWETEAILQGSPKGYKRPVSVAVSLRIKAGDVYITPTRVIDGPDSTSATAKIVDGDDLSPDAQRAFREAFTLKLSGAELPLRKSPMRVYVSGGSIYVESEQFYTTVSLDDLTPHVEPLPEEERPGL